MDEIQRARLKWLLLATLSEDLRPDSLNGYSLSLQVQL